MSSLKPVKATKKDEGENNLQQKKRSGKRKASSATAVRPLKYDKTPNYSHSLGDKPLPEGGIEFFQNSKSMWPGTWNARLNLTAFLAKRWWKEEEFTTLYRANVPDPNDQADLATIRSVFESSSSDIDDGNDSKKALKRLIINDLREQIDVFHSSDHIGFARLKSFAVPNVVTVRGQQFSSFVKSAIFKKRRHILGKHQIEELVSFFEALALHDSRMDSVYLRVARSGPDSILCLGGDAGCIRIFPNKSLNLADAGFELVEESQINFLKSKGSASLPKIQHTDIFSIKSIINSLFDKFINISTEEERLLCVSALVSYLVSGPGDFIFLIFEGEQGSGKTTAMEFAKMTIDPSPIEKNLLPRNEEDLFLFAQHMHILGFDNVSGIPSKISDCLCMLSTGGAAINRALYTNQDLNVMNAKRPVFLNGIEASPERADLLDRSVVFNIEALASQKSKADMYKEFQSDWPFILMALVQIASYALAKVSEIDDFGSFRMSDYAKVGCATAEYLGYEKSYFIEAYRSNKSRSSLLILENDIIAKRLLSSFTANEKFDGTATKLHDILKPINDFEQSRLFPKTVATFGKALTRIAPVLKKHGFTIVIDRTSDYRSITIQMPNQHNPIWRKLDTKSTQARRDFGKPEVENDDLT